MEFVMASRYLDCLIGRLISMTTSHTVAGSILFFGSFYQDEYPHCNLQLLYFVLKVLSQVFYLELIYLYFSPFFHLTVVVSVLLAFLVGVEVTSVSWLGQLTVDTRPVENVVLTTKGLQDRNNNCQTEGRWKIKVN